MFFCLLFYLTGSGQEQIKVSFHTFLGGCAFNQDYLGDFGDDKKWVLENVNTMFSILRFPLTIDTNYQSIIHNFDCLEITHPNEDLLRETISDLLTEADLSRVQIFLIRGIIPFRFPYTFGDKVVECLFIPESDRMDLKTYTHELLHTKYGKLDDVYSNRLLIPNGVLDANDNWCSNIMSYGVGPFNFLNTYAQADYVTESTLVDNITIYSHRLPCIPIVVSDEIYCLPFYSESEYRCCNEIKTKLKVCPEERIDEISYDTTPMNADGIMNEMYSIYQIDSTEYYFKNKKLTNQFRREEKFLIDNGFSGMLGYSERREEQYYSRIRDRLNMEIVRYKLEIENPELLQNLITSPEIYTLSSVRDSLFGDVSRKFRMEEEKKGEKYEIYDGETVRIYANEVFYYSKYNTAELYYMLIFDERRGLPVLDYYLQDRYQLDLRWDND